MSTADKGVEDYGLPFLRKGTRNEERLKLTGLSRKILRVSFQKPTNPIDITTAEAAKKKNKDTSDPLKSGSPPDIHPNHTNQ